LNEIEDLEMDQEFNEIGTAQPKPAATTGGNKEAEILDVDDIPDFE
jgi:hypothetical protein